MLSIQLNLPRAAKSKFKEKKDVMHRKGKGRGGGGGIFGSASVT